MLNDKFKSYSGEHLKGKHKKGLWVECLKHLNQCSSSRLKGKLWPHRPEFWFSSKVVRSELSLHCVFTFISQHPEMCWRGLLKERSERKVFANQCIGQHVTEYFWPVGCGCALIKGEYSVWTSHLAEGRRSSRGQNRRCRAEAVGLILWCLRELVDASQNKTCPILSCQTDTHYTANTHSLWISPRDFVFGWLLNCRADFRLLDPNKSARHCTWKTEMSIDMLINTYFMWISNV